MLKPRKFKNVKNSKILEKSVNVKNGKIVRT